MHDFVTSGSNIGPKNYTQTYINYDRRQTRKILNADIGFKDNGELTKRNRRANDDIYAILKQLTDDYQKKHPGMSKIKARVEVKKTPLGRKYNRLFNAGYSASQIRSALYSKRSKSSSGSRGG